MPYSIPAVPVVVVAAAPGSGKTWLLNQWASQVPAGQRWTFITRGDASAFSESAGPTAPKADGALIIALAHDCACCNGKLVLRTHLARTLRMRRPDRLFIEAALDDHLPATLAWLEGPDWTGWLTDVRCVALLPLVQEPDALSAPECLALTNADVVCFSPPSQQLDPALAARRLLQARQIGGAQQWRINAPLKKLEWGVVQQTLATARRRI